jgi:hypothetical protein
VASLKSLLRHRKSHEDVDGIAKPKKEKSEKIREFPFKCLVDGCGKSFFVEQFYIAHMKIHKGVDVSIVCPMNNVSPNKLLQSLFYSAQNL